MRGTGCSAPSEAMLDLLITNAALPDGRTGMSVAVEQGRISEIAPQLSAPARAVACEALMGSETEKAP